MNSLERVMISMIVGLLVVVFFSTNGLAEGTSCPADVSFPGNIVNSFGLTTLPGGYCSTATFTQACQQYGPNASAITLACAPEAVPAATADCRLSVSNSCQQASQSATISQTQVQQCQDYCATQPNCFGVATPAPTCVTSSEYDAAAGATMYCNSKIMYVCQGQSIGINLGQVTCNADLYAHALCQCFDE